MKNKNTKNFQAKNKHMKNKTKNFWDRNIDSRIEIYNKTYEERNKELLGNNKDPHRRL